MGPILLACGQNLVSKPILSKMYNSVTHRATAFFLIFLSAVNENFNKNLGNLYRCSKHQFGKRVFVKSSKTVELIGSI